MIFSVDMDRWGTDHFAGCLLSGIWNNCGFPAGRGGHDQRHVVNFIGRNEVLLLLAEVLQQWYISGGIL